MKNFKRHIFSTLDLTISMVLATLILGLLSAISKPFRDFAMGVLTVRVPLYWLILCLALVVLAVAKLRKALVKANKDATEARAQLEEKKAQAKKAKAQPQTRYLPRREGFVNRWR